MNRRILPSPAFERNLKKLLKRQPKLSTRIETVIDLMAVDLEHPKLATHKLKGKLAECLSCTVGGWG